MSDNQLYAPTIASQSNNMVGPVVARLTYLSRLLPSYNHENSITVHNEQGVIDTDFVSRAEEHIFQAGVNDNDQTYSEMPPEEKRSTLYRQRRTRAMQKHRKKINDKAIALTDSIIQLKAEIDQLNKQRMLSTPLYGLSSDTSWRMVVEYVRLFRYGYKPPTLIMKPGGTTTTFPMDANSVQKSFLHAVMSPDVAFNGDRQGVHAMFEDWKFISQRHEHTETQLTSLECGPGGLQIAHMDNMSIITAKMIRKYLLEFNDGEPSWPLFATKILGQKLVIPTIVGFEWDEMNSHFASVYYEADMLTPLLQLLGNLKDANRVVNSDLGSHCKL